MRSMKHFFLCLMLCTLVFTGCGGAKKKGEKKEEKKGEAKERMDKKEEKKKDDEVKKEENVKKADEKKEAVKNENKAAKEGPRERKIKYSGRMKVIVEDFSKASDDLERLVKKNKGYVASSQIESSPGQPRSGHWKLRIPVAQFDAIRAEIAKLGEPELNTTDSEDVTEEYYDLKAHIKNKKEEEASLQKLFLRKDANLDSIIKVQDRLTEVRTTIDQLEGRLRAIGQLTEMTTLEVDLHDRHTYVPPESATFDTTIGRVFQGSWEALVTFGKGIVLVCVAVAPWLLVLAVAGVPCWLIYRRQRRLASAIKPVSTTGHPPSPT
jgi:hypothetical protein